MHFSLWLKPDEIITLMKKTFSSRETSLTGCCISLLGSRLYIHLTNFYICILFLNPLNFPSNTTFCYEQNFFFAE